MALPLIDKQDTSEIIRDQIAAILVLEVVNQKALAVSAGKDPTLWDLKVYLERSNPWEQYQDDNPDITPIVNVWFDSENFDAKGSNYTERQKTTGTFNIDVHAVGITADNGAGHDPGDRSASIEVQRAVRLVRNILMAAENKYLQLARGIAWDRFPQNITVFQVEGQSAQKIMGARLAFSVTYNEFSPQITGEIMELLSVNINRNSDGQLLAEADYTYPIT